MSMLDGVTQCWWLSENCVLNWSAWSAVATAFAGVIALFVGLMPMTVNRRQRARVGRAEARVAASDLNVQALHVAAGLRLIESESTPAYIYRVAVAQFRVLDIESCRRVVPYLDVLPGAVEGPISDVISDIGIGIRMLDRLNIEDGEMRIDAAGPRDLYTSVLRSMESARVAISAAIDGCTIEDLSQPAQELATKLRIRAREDLVEKIRGMNHVR